MARPKKMGLDYWPFDVGFFEDEKIQAIGGEFGIKGEIVTIRLLNAVYRDGYFIVWNELQNMKLARQLDGVGPQLIDAIVTRLVLWGVFDKSLFDSAKVLTSKGIQERYFEATKRRGLSGENLPYLLINVCKNSVNVYNNPDNADIYPQSKVKETKVNKSKVKEKNTPPIIPTGDGESSEDFLKFKDYLNRIAPRVEQMESPFTEFEYQQIKDVYCGDYVGYLVREMNNHKDLLSRNVSAFHTFKQWTTRRMADRKLYNKPITLQEFEGRQRLAQEKRGVQVPQQRHEDCIPAPDRWLKSES